MENSQTPHIELPKPVHDTDAFSAGSEASSSMSPEQASRPEVVGSQAQQPVISNIPASSQGMLGRQTPAQQPHDSPVNSDNPAIADDVDLIEKEWVQKARAIVDKTKDDPHLQNKELNTFKADYMKKRYGKDIKLTND